MFDFGDELTIHRIPWLVWIQLLIMLLIIVFLYCCSIIAFDFSGDDSATSPSVLFASAGSDVDKPLRNSNAGAVISSHHNTKAGRGGGSQSRRGERGSSTSRRRGRGEDMLEREAASDKDVTQHISLSDTCYHPCYYIRLARRVFLKCLGLDSTSDDSSTPERRRGFH